MQSSVLHGRRQCTNDYLELFTIGLVQSSGPRRPIWKNLESFIVVICCNQQNTELDFWRDMEG